MNLTDLQLQTLRQRAQLNSLTKQPLYIDPLELLALFDALDEATELANDFGVDLAEAQDSLTELERRLSEYAEAA